MSIAVLPFDIAADGVGQGDGNGFSVEVFLYGSFQIVDGHFAGITWIVNAAAGVN